MFIERKIFSISKKVFSFSHRAFLRSEEYIPKETKEEMGRKVISISEKIVSKTSSFLSSLKQKIFSKEAVPLSEKLIENNLEKTVSIPLVDGISKGDLTEISIGDFLNHKLQNEFLPKITDKINFLNLNIFNLNLKEKKVLDYILQNKKEILPFVISSPFVQFSSVFGSVVWVSFDLFSKEIIQSQELDKIKLKNKTQTQFKTLQKNNISNNIDNKNIIYQQNKKEEANLLKNTPRPKNEEKKKKIFFF